jgi:hypothetical protein
MTTLHAEECECDQPEVRASFQDGDCSEEQILKCHGKKFLDRMKAGDKL